MTQDFPLVNVRNKKLERHVEPHQNKGGFLCVAMQRAVSRRKNWKLRRSFDMHGAKNISRS